MKCLRVATQYKGCINGETFGLCTDSVPCDTCLTVKCFLVKTKFQPCLNRCILLISCHVISEMIQVWAQRSSPPTPIEEIQQKAIVCLAAIPKKVVRDVSSSGRTPKRSVCMPRGSSLRVTGLRFCTQSFYYKFDHPT